MTQISLAGVLLVFLVVLYTSNGYTFLKHQGKPAKRSLTRPYYQQTTPFVGEPLILTDHILNGEIELGRNLSKVVDLDGYGYTSYSGYFTVQSDYNSNMFFWFFPAQNGNVSAPLVLWLQGGPGAPSMFGLFLINGPFYVTENLELMMREYHWNLEYNLLYIDNPVRTGYSFTDSDAGLATNQDEVAVNLYRTMEQFYIVFPEYKANDLYLTGESYAGKYVPSMGFKIHEENQAAGPDQFINLVGIVLGNPLNDPINTLDTYRELYYGLGLVNYQESQYIESQTLLANILMEGQAFIEANNVINDLVDYCAARTGLNLENYMTTETIPEYYIDYLEQDHVRRKIHVGSTTFENFNQGVIDALENDVMASQAEAFAFLINHGYKTLLYSGIQDLLVGASMTENSIRSLCFEGRNEYLNATKIIWRLNSSDTDVAGYASKVGNFQRVIVRGAGHVVPHDQPLRALVMIDNFIKGNEF